MEKEPILIANKIQTPDGTILWSRFRHDCVFYEDANGERYQLDGGVDYRIISQNKESAKDLSVYSNEKYAVIRENLLVEVYSENERDYLWIPLSKLSDNDLDGLRNTRMYQENTLKDIIECEIPYRMHNNIKVPSTGYWMEDAIKNIIKK